MKSRSFTVSYSSMVLHLCIILSGFQLYGETSALLRCFESMNSPISMRVAAALAPSAAASCHSVWVWSRIGVALLCFFLTESGCKILSLGWQRFWADPWNRVDVILSFVFCC